MSVKLFTQADLDRYTSRREGETKIGQVVSIPAESATLESAVKDAAKRQARYAVILVAEDIGSRANLGRAGAHRAPAAFLSYFLNMQANRFFDHSKVLLLGEVDVADLMAMSETASVEELRKLCAQLDERIAPVVRAVVSSGLEPVVIGGCNNNSYPTIKGVCEALELAEGLATVNCDPHADFRRLEGRHSGNPFSYAHKNGYLKRYCVLGLHESYNSEDMLERLVACGFKYLTYESFAIRRELSFEESVKEACTYLAAADAPIGCELDLDGIRQMPSSAKSPFGITPEQAAYYLYTIASTLNTRYLHLSEAAPVWGGEEGDREAGKTMALCVQTYLKAREQYRRTVPLRTQQPAADEKPAAKQALAAEEKVA